MRIIYGDKDVPYVKPLIIRGFNDTSFNYFEEHKKKYPAWGILICPEYGDLRHYDMVTPDSTAVHKVEHFASSRSDDQVIAKALEMFPTYDDEGDPKITSEPSKKPRGIFDGIDMDPSTPPFSRPFWESSHDRVSVFGDVGRPPHPYERPFERDSGRNETLRAEVRLPRIPIRMHGSHALEGAIRDAQHNFLKNLVDNGAVKVEIYEDLPSDTIILRLTSRFFLFEKPIERI